VTLAQTLGRGIRAVDRVQRARLFKIIASMVVLLAVAGIYTGFAIDAAQTNDAARDGFVDEAGEAVDGAAPGSTPLTGDPVTDRLIGELLSGKSDLGGLAVGLGVAAALALVIIWIGLGITFFALALVAFIAQRVLIGELGMELIGRVTFGVTILSIAFIALLRGARLVLSGASPTFAIASNVLQEAVRMRLSMVFIVIVILGLSGLPMVLDEDTELRYRVQAFLQYAMAGSFWVIALLTLTFGVATVAFEQRDKVIWQTITKPVSPFRYILGKWLGVTILSGILMGVCSAGTFLFVEYLRDQPASGETEAYVTDSNELVTTDRLLLETQVLAARRGVGPVVPFRRDSQEFAEALEQYILQERVADENFATDPRIRSRVEADLLKNATDTYFSIGPGQAREYQFEGLETARDAGLPITLTYRVDAAGDRPDVTYKVWFFLSDGTPIRREIGLGINHTVSLNPQFIDEDGVLRIQMINGELINDPRFGSIVRGNPTSISIPPSELEISYRDGHYGWNFARITVVLWIKLAFLAAIAVWGASFLSFPVACLVAIGVFLMAESTGFMSEALGLYGIKDADQNVQIHRVISYGIAHAVNVTFSVYNDLRPTQRLVDGRVLTWGTLGAGLGTMALIAGAFLGMATVAMRRRELALYSGR
jgi:ABC-type transport system involved in multi-copper enzyme maturation permease subunit